MATSLPCYLTVPSPKAMGRGSEPLKSSFLSSGKVFSVAPRRSEVGVRRCYNSYFKEALKDVPKQFRGENLPDGLIENYKNLPKFLYGPSPLQMHKFTSEGFCQQEDGAEDEDEDEDDDEGKDFLAITEPETDVEVEYSEKLDLASYVLAKRVIFLGMPIVEEVTELIVSQFYFLDMTDPRKPIHFYINSTGTVDEEGETVGSENDAYAIADVMLSMRARVITRNMGNAEGQAAMLLSLGEKGTRASMQMASTALYLPETFRTSGRTTDLWTKREELDMINNYYLELLSLGTGKTEEELYKDLQELPLLDAKEAVEYGIVDKVLAPYSDKGRPKVLEMRKKKKKNKRPGQS